MRLCKSYLVHPSSVQANFFTGTGLGGLSVLLVWTRTKGARFFLSGFVRSRPSVDTGISLEVMPSSRQA